MNSACRSARLELARQPPGSPLPAEVEQHLSACGACQREREADDQVWSLLAELPVPAAPDALLPAVQARVLRPADELANRRAHQTQSRAHPRARFWYAAAAAAMVLIGSGSGLWLGSQHAGGKSDARQSAPDPDAWSDHAQLFSVDPPGSLTRAYASLERNEVAQ